MAVKRIGLARRVLEAFHMNTLIVRLPRVALFAAVLFCTTGMRPVQAAVEDELKVLQQELAVISQAQQSIFQQFQMIAQLRRLNAENPLPPAGGYPPRNYEDVVAERQARAEREDEYARQLEDLYARYRELDAERRPILDRLRSMRP